MHCPGRIELIHKPNFFVISRTYHCPNYVRKYCPYLEKAPHVCNGCTDTRKCVYEKQYYRAHVADEQATNDYFGRKGDTLLTDEQLKQVDALISPLIIKKHQSPSAALIVVKDDLKRLGIKLSLATTALTRKGAQNATIKC